MKKITCGQLNKTYLDQEVTLYGWVNRVRNLGGLMFIDLRDRWGITQLFIDPADKKELAKQADKLRPEYLVAVKGLVKKRPAESINPKIGTGEIEVHVTEMELLNPSKVPVMNIADDEIVDESLRLKYRYLDLRRPRMQNNLILRYKVTKAIRDFLDKEDFLEIETPMLIRSTPEGARDYLVPSRKFPGCFFALPQSPQLFKQLLMVSGFERYFQIARCFRDEDQRTDRQPEFTQLDMEMSFVQKEDVLAVTERLMAYLFKQVLNIDLELPFLNLTHRQAMSSYGTDKPDLRYDMQIIDLTDAIGETDFGVFNETLGQGGRIKGINLKGKSDLSRKDIDNLGKLAAVFGGKGIFTVAVKDTETKTSLKKYLSDEKLAKINSLMNAEAGDLIIITADKEASVILGKLRLELVKQFKIPAKEKFSFLWVTDFPMFNYNEEEGRLDAEHHAFTSVLPEDLPLLDTEPLKVRANAYDLVLNGTELGSGSIRIHLRSVQEKIFRLIGLSWEEAKEKFGFLLDAFEYGAPPHGGIAPGLDRLVMLMAGEETIREVIAFPKNQNAACLMTNAPFTVSKEQLDVLGIEVKALAKV